VPSTLDRTQEAPPTAPLSSREVWYTSRPFLWRHPDLYLAGRRRTYVTTRARLDHRRTYGDKSNTSWGCSGLKAVVGYIYVPTWAAVGSTSRTLPSPSRPSRARHLPPREYLPADMNPPYTNKHIPLQTLVTNQTRLYPICFIYHYIITTKHIQYIHAHGRWVSARSVFRGMAGP
jgi:hypothetical protein